MAFPVIPAAVTGARGLMAARRAGLIANPVPKQLMTAASAANKIPPSMGGAYILGGGLAGTAVGIEILQQDPQELGAKIARANLSLQEGIEQIKSATKDALILNESPGKDFIEGVKSGYEAEVMRRSSREVAEQQNPLGARSGRQVMQEGGDVSMLPNAAPAPIMSGTPMGGDLSAPMAPAQAKLDPAEMQEAKGALMQIIQIIQMLVNQGMSEAEIQQFLAQYGITEEELDQAAEILGVDIDALIAGQQRMPMAGGGMPDPLAPAPVPKTPEMMIFSINSEIDNLMQEYNMAVRNNEFERAQAIADEIDGLQQQIINLQESKVPPMAGLNMRFGGSAAGK